MATVNPNSPFHAAVAATDLSAKQYYAVKLDTASKIALAGNGEGVGVLVDDPASGKIGTIGMAGFQKGIAGGTFAENIALSSDANSKLVTATTGDEVFCRSMEDGVVNQIVRVQVSREGILA